MIEWSQKSRRSRASSKTQKIPGPKINPQENPMPILWLLKVPERGNAITQTKTLKMLFIHHTISHHILTMLEWVLETPKKGFV